MDDIIVPLELGELGYSKEKTLGEALGKDALQQLGRMSWEKNVHEVVLRLTAAFRTDYLVIGGGNAKLLRRLPPGARRGSNQRTFLGGARLWRTGAFYATPKKHTWVIA